MKTLNIAFIGAGNMTNAIIGGLVASGFPAQNIHAANRSAKKLEDLSNSLGVLTYAVNTDVVSKADVLVLAVKPNILHSVCSQIKAEVLANKPLIISIAAGVSINTLQQWLDPSLTVVRCMPNTPSLVQLGASGLYTPTELTSIQKHQCETIMHSVGIAYWVDTEEQLDAVTAISGSGPAYFFLIVDIMQKIGCELGLSEWLSQELVLQTILGAAHMAKTSDYTVSELRRRVTSPGGTTEAALNVFEKENLEHIFRNALQAANQRSKSLALELAQNNV